MKKLVFLFFGIISTISSAQNDKSYVDGLVSNFTKSLESRQITNFFYMNKYCDGSIEIFKLSDGSMCASKEIYYEVFVFWKEENQAMIKKIDNCGMYFSLSLNNLNVLDFVQNNTDQLKDGEVINYAVKNPENVPVKSSEIHPCHRLFQFNLENKTFGQTYDLFDLTNESKYENLNFDSNNKLKIVALEKMVEGLILENETKFRRQNL